MPDGSVLVRQQSDDDEGVDEVVLDLPTLEMLVHMVKHAKD